MYSLFRQGTQKESGEDVLRSNILAVRTLSEMLKSSLGPRGLDKMLISSTNDVTVTNDGVTIVKEMDVQHPAAKLVVEAAKAQDTQVGDGTTSAVVLTGFLLEQAEKLLDQKVHPTIIIEGYKRASDIILSHSKEVAIKINTSDKDYLRKVTYTSLSSKFFSGESTLNKIIDISIDAVVSIAKKQDSSYNIDLSDIKFVKKRGESVDETELIRGFVLDKEVAHENMPRRIEKAKIAIIDFPLEVEKPEISAKMSFTSPDQIREALEEQSKYVKSLVDALANVGANVIVSQKGMDDIASYFMAKKKIIGVKNVSRSDLEKLAKSVGAKIITTIKDVSPDDLGYAEVVEERKIGNSKAVFFEGAKQGDAVTILIRGSSDIVMDELERSFQDSLNTVKNVLQYPYVVAGGGAFEMEMALKLREEARKIGGKEQLAVEAYADALEEFAITLAETAGLDSVDALVQLRNLHSKGLRNAGINVESGKVEEDMAKIGVLDPLIVKEQVIKSSTEAATAILKIDDYIAAAPAKPQPQQGQGGEGGGGMMPGMMG
ncbi:thermosome subunit alpha [Sulfurisphaera tokodaii]|uniref:Rosettasome gamma subunit n=2 Tax=Sulfurisphaera tokodaii TaxID=111955 RepID=F9VN97_SULTO|nr:thermosome subunit alpha [Sulfurisphaera tokodaii]BAK54394.1 rosettasome gamma subunit [Sulfurisphaera tokodaii str. 7]HII74392.1 thermosome subunit [Sulfurisphaera tokodaii]